MKILFIALFFLFTTNISLSKTKKSKSNSKEKKSECALNFQEIRSLLDQKPSRFKSIESEITDKVQRTVSQVAWLKTGEKVKFTSGGCTHFNYAFSYTDFKKKKFKDAEEQKKLAIKLLKKTPAIEASVLISALQKTEVLKEELAGLYLLECGEAKCKLDLSVKDRIKITYSMKL